MHEAVDGDLLDGDLLDGDGVVHAGNGGFGKGLIGNGGLGGLIGNGGATLVKEEHEEPKVGFSTDISIKKDSLCYVTIFWRGLRAKIFLALLRFSNNTYMICSLKT